MGRFVGETAQLWLPLLSVVISCCATRVLGFPMGAGSCIGGQAAVGGLHLTRPLTTATTFIERGIEISIGGTLVTPGQNLGLIAGDDLEVVITAKQNPFRGALIRLESTQGQSVLMGIVPGTNAAVATACQAPVVGITHFDNSTKTAFSGTLMVETLGQATLDITVVEINSATESIYMYGGYDVVFTTAGADQAPAPATAPVPALAPVPVPVPVLGPVAAPAPATAPAPVSAPVPVFGPVTVPAPVSAPVPVFGPVTVPAPISAPVPALGPVTAPVPLPISAPIPVPIPVPAPIPVSLPVPAPIPVPVPVPAPIAVPQPVPVPSAGSIPTPTAGVDDVCPSSKGGKGSASNSTSVQSPTSGTGADSSRSSKKCKLKKKKKKGSSSKAKIKLSKSQASASAPTSSARRRHLRV